MDFTAYFRSIMEQDPRPIVICSPEHEILYMNPAATSGENEKNAGLLGKSLCNCHSRRSQEKLKEIVAWFQESTAHNEVYIQHKEKENEDLYMVALRDESGGLIGYYERHERRNRESGKLYDM